MVDKAIIIGGSAGSLTTLLSLVTSCPAHLDAPMIVVVHRGNHQKNTLLELISRRSKRPVIEVEHFDKLENGNVYLAPSNYHLLIGADHHLELDLSEKVLFSRPSIDVSFGSFATVFKENLIAVVLSGANEDCAAGAKEVMQNGGTVLVQDPEEAEVNIMPQKTLDLNPDITHILSASQIMNTILNLTNH